MEKLVDVLSNDGTEDVTDLEEDSELELSRLLFVLDVLESVDVMLGLNELDVRLVDVDDIEVEGDPPPPPPTLELEEEEDTEQASATTVFGSTTIDAPIAKSPPSEVADVSSVSDSAARIVPWKEDPAPGVADDPTCQQTLHGSAPPVSATIEFVAVFKVDPIWKYQVLLEDPVPASFQYSRYLCSRAVFVCSRHQTHATTIAA
ncbi:unnamed protein product [Sphagnum balticum]